MTTFWKKWLLIPALLVNATTTLLAQDKSRATDKTTDRITGWIAGRIKEVQGQPIPFATVTVFDRHTMATVKAAQTDSTGAFFIGELPDGIFTCKITYAGYQTIVRDSIVVSPGSNTISVGDLTMTPSGNVLTEVAVTASSPTLRSGLDKKVFSVNQSLISLGGSASDLLQNVPTLQIDASGNISLRGASNLRVLVDGKRSLIGGGTITQILQSIPASFIDRIEVITNPSAKYDAEGQGIINIILKKNGKPGFNNSIALNAGTRGNYNAGTNISYQNSRINVYANYSYQHRNIYSNGFQNMSYLQSSDATYYSNEAFPSITIVEGHSIKGGIDYTMSSKNTISLSGDFNTTYISRNESLTIDNLTVDHLPVLLSNRYNRTDGNAHSYAASLDLTHKFNKPKEELTFDFTYSRGTTNNLQGYTTNVTNINGQPITDSTAILRDDKTNINTNYNIQADYTLPIGKNAKLEAGYRTQIILTDNRQWDDNFNKENLKYEPDYGLINFFTSNSQVHAVYINYRQQIRKFTLQLGLRGETGNLKAHLQSFDTAHALSTTPITIDTRGLYPALFLTRQFSNGRQLQLSYTRRVNRPTPREINPFWDVSDPVNYEAGNPKLVPEDIHSVELTYAVSWPKVSLTSGAYYTQVNNVIKHIESNPVNDVIITTAQNLKRAINTGLEFIGNFNLTKAWSFTANVNIYERVNAAAPEYGISATQGLSWNANITSNLSIARKLTLQLRGDYKASEVIIQDRDHPAWGIDAAVKYDFWHDKASLALNSRDIFNTRKWAFLRVSDGLLLDFQRVTYSARASLTFTWRFGKSTFEAKKQNKQEAQDKRIENR